MALVIGHFDNTATVRIMEAQRAQAEKFEAKILDLTKKLNDCINSVTILSKSSQIRQGRDTSKKTSIKGTKTSNSMNNLAIPALNVTRAQSTDSQRSHKRQRPDDDQSDDENATFAQRVAQNKDDNDGFTEVKSKKKKNKKKGKGDNSNPRSPLISGTGKPIKDNLNAAPKTSKCVMINLDNKLSLNDLKAYCQQSETLSKYMHAMSFNEIGQTHNGRKIRVICQGWPSANSINFGDPALWPYGATIKTLRGNQRTIDANLDPTKRRFVCKLFSNLKPEQTLEGVKSCIETNYKASTCTVDVEVHVKEFDRKDRKNTDKKAFIVLVVPKDKKETITDILKDKYPPSNEYSFNKLICRPWGGKIPEEIAQHISETKVDEGNNLMS